MFHEAVIDERLFHGIVNALSCIIVDVFVQTLTRGDDLEHFIDQAKLSFHNFAMFPRAQNSSEVKQFLGQFFDSLKSTIITVDQIIHRTSVYVSPSCIDMAIHQLMIPFKTTKMRAK